MKQKVNGFTIVEVALVLAVAGMIFAITFAVLPGLWASERDTARRDDMMNFITQLKKFQTSSNRGALPKPNDENATEFQGGKSYSVLGSDAAEARSNKDKNNSNTWKGFYRDFFNDDFRDPNGNYYNLEVMFCTTTQGDDNKCSNSLLGSEASGSLGKIGTNESRINDTIYVVIGATCDGDTAIKSANPRRVAALYRLEHAGQYCYND